VNGYRRQIQDKYERDWRNKQELKEGYDRRIMKKQGMVEQNRRLIDQLHKGKREAYLTVRNTLCKERNADMEC